MRKSPILRDCLARPSGEAGLRATLLVKTHHFMLPLFFGQICCRGAVIMVVLVARHEVRQSVSIQVGAAGKLVESAQVAFFYRTGILVEVAFVNEPMPITLRPHFAC